VRTAVQKGGGKMADAGSVMFNFQRAGVIIVEPTLSEDEVHACAAPVAMHVAEMSPAGVPVVSVRSLQAQVLDVAADAGAEDVQPVVEDSELTGFKASWTWRFGWYFCFVLRPACRSRLLHRCTHLRRVCCRSARQPRTSWQSTGRSEMARCQ
jgi:hypothetical protein